MNIKAEVLNSLLLSKLYPTLVIQMIATFLNHKLLGLVEWGMEQSGIFWFVKLWWQWNLSRSSFLLYYLLCQLLRLLAQCGLLSFMEKCGEEGIFKMCLWKGPNKWIVLIVNRMILMSIKKDKSLPLGSEVVL